MTLAILAALLLALANAVAVWLWLDHIACEHYAREWDARREPERARMDAAMSEPTPVYDRLVCEHIERAEGWR